MLKLIPLCLVLFAVGCDSSTEPTDCKSVCETFEENAAELDYEVRNGLITLREYARAYEQEQERYGSCGCED